MKHSHEVAKKGKDIAKKRGNIQYWFLTKQQPVVLENCQRVPRHSRTSYRARLILFNLPNEKRSTSKTVSKQHKECESSLVACNIWSRDCRQILLLPFHLLLRLLENRKEELRLEHAILRQIGTVDGILDLVLSELSSQSVWPDVSGHSCENFHM